MQTEKKGGGGYEEEGEEGGLLHLCHLEVGHVHSATFVINDSPINHERASVNAQWLCSAGGLSLWMPGLQPQCPTPFSLLPCSSCPSARWHCKMTLPICPLCTQILPFSAPVIPVPQ